MIGNNLDYNLEGCFDSSILNHISLTPPSNPSPKPCLKHTLSLVQQSDLVVESDNPTPILQILEKAMNLDDFEHPAGESIDDQKQLTYFSNSEQPPHLNPMLEPP